MQLINNPITATHALIERPTYQFVSTHDILAKLESLGWRVDRQQIQRVRKPERNGFQKHLVTLVNDSMPSIQGLARNNESKLTINVMNAHDGTSALCLYWGLLRMACLNGVFAGNAVQGVRLCHNVNVMKALPDALDDMMTRLPTFLEKVQTLQNTQWSAETYDAFRCSAIKERLASIKSGVWKIDTVHSTYPRRREDMDTDAFTCFNRVQEVVVRGGIHYQSIDGTWRNTRRITGARQLLKTNRDLFDKALSYV
jgi:hypothetical protein